MSINNNETSADTTKPQRAVGTEGVLRKVLHEFTKFGFVGISALTMDIGLFNLLIIASDTSSIIAKIISTSVATIFSYFGNKFWSFRAHHDFTIKHVFSQQHRKHHTKEFAQFVGVNLIALSFSLFTLYISHNILGFTSVLADNIAANVIGLGLGTLFRFYAYRTWLFKNPNKPDNPPFLI